VSEWNHIHATMQVQLSFWTFSELPCSTSFQRIRSPFAKPLVLQGPLCPDLRRVGKPEKLRFIVEAPLKLDVESSQASKQELRLFTPARSTRLLSTLSLCK
jgi:hypothetical protein